MNFQRTSFQFGLLVSLGIVVFAAAYISLGRTAAAFFGFVYIVMMPLLYEFLQRVPKQTASGGSV